MSMDTVNILLILTNVSVQNATSVLIFNLNHIIWIMSVQMLSGINYTKCPIHASTYLSVFFIHSPLYLSDLIWSVNSPLWLYNKSFFCHFCFNGWTRCLEEIIQFKFSSFHIGKCYVLDGPAKYFMWPMLIRNRTNLVVNLVCCFVLLRIN